MGVHDHTNACGGHVNHADGRCDGFGLARGKRTGAERGVAQDSPRQESDFRKQIAYAY